MSGCSCHKKRNWQLAGWRMQVAEDTDEEMVSALAARMQEQGIRLDVVELDAPGGCTA